MNLLLNNPACSPYYVRISASGRITANHVADGKSVKYFSNQVKAELWCFKKNNSQQAITIRSRIAARLISIGKANLVPSNWFNQPIKTTVISN